MDINRSYRDVNAGARAAGGHHLESDGWHVQRQRLGCLHQHLHLRLPSNPYSSQAMRDPAGFGGTDYFATVYTDINTATGIRQKTVARMEGALTVVVSTDTNTGESTPNSGGQSNGITSDYTDRLVVTSVPISAIADGTSNTIAVIEDAGRVSITATGAGIPTTPCRVTRKPSPAPC